MGVRSLGRGLAWVVAAATLTACGGGSRPGAAGEGQDEDARAIAASVVFGPDDLPGEWRYGREQPLTGGTWDADAIEACLRAEGLVPIASTSRRLEREVSDATLEGVESLALVLDSAEAAGEAFEWASGDRLVACLRANHEERSQFGPNEILDLRQSVMDLRGTESATRYVALEWRVDFPDRIGRVQQDAVLTVSSNVFAMALMKGVTAETADRVVIDLPRRIEEVRAESVESARRDTRWKP